MLSEQVAHPRRRQRGRGRWAERRRRRPMRTALCETARPPRPNEPAHRDGNQEKHSRFYAARVRRDLGWSCLTICAQSCGRREQQQPSRACRTTVIFLLDCVWCEYVRPALCRSHTLPPGAAPQQPTCDGRRARRARRRCARKSLTPRRAEERQLRPARCRLFASAWHGGPPTLHRHCAAAASSSTSHRAPCPDSSQVDHDEGGERTAVGRWSEYMDSQEQQQRLGTSRAAAQGQPAPHRPQATTMQSTSRTRGLQGGEG